MKPIFSLRRRERSSSERSLTSAPSTRYLAVSKLSRRPATFRNVVLPEPDGPVTATNSPAFTVSEKSRSACVSIRSARKILLMLCISSMTRFLYSIRDRDFVDTVEVAHVCDDHFVARGEAPGDFNFGDRGGAQL